MSPSRRRPRQLLSQRASASYCALVCVETRLAAQAREVATFDLRGKKVARWIAPTRDHGFCFAFEHGFGSCSAGRARRHLGVVFMTKDGGPIPVITKLGGWVLGAEATSLRIDYQGGGYDNARLVYVSRPIDAAFFLFEVPNQHLLANTRVTQITALDKDGRILGRSVAPRSERRRARGYPGPPLRPLHPSLPHVGTPAAPLQHGTGQGVSLVAGANGVVVFDTRHITPHARSLIHTASYGCFRLTQEFGIPSVRGGGIAGGLVGAGPVVRMRLDGVGTPFDGCQIFGSWGHRWPDRNGSHSPVEIPLTPAGRRFFADRAAARDLGLFVRLPSVRRIRAETGTQLERGLSRYGIKRLSSVNVHFQTGRIGYAPRRRGVTFVEWSPTGRRFFVEVKRGKVVRANLRQYAWVL